MDIIERLREHCEDLTYEAADEIERLREALRPFAEKYLWPDDSGYADELRSDEDWDEERNEEEVDDVWVKRKWIRQARVELNESE